MCDTLILPVLHEDHPIQPVRGYLCKLPSPQNRYSNRPGPRAVVALVRLEILRNS